MAKMKDQSYAQAFRDRVERIARNIVRNETPQIRLGKVYSYNPETKTAMILFAGQKIDSLVKVRVADNMRPTSFMEDTFAYLSYNAPGDIVRIFGKPGSYFILDFYSGSPASLGEVVGGESEIHPGTVDDYWRGDKTWQKLSPVLSFNFASVSTSWTILHELNTLDPKVTCYDINGEVMLGDITVLDLNQVRVDWYFPSSGSARVSR